MSTIYNRRSTPFGMGIKYHTKIVAAYAGALKITIKKIDMSNDVFDVVEHTLEPAAVQAIVKHFAGAQ